MGMVDSPLISSFVIRIVEEPVPQYPAPVFRGMIRHIQSDQEISFTNWVDAETFITKFVPINKMSAVEGCSQIPDSSERDN